MKNPIRDYFRSITAIEQAKREGRTAEWPDAAIENHELQQMQMRPARYETVDGSGEIGWGMALICFALSGYASAVKPVSETRNLISWVFLLCAVVAMPVSRWLIKKFITWPRTGYVAYNNHGRQFWTTIILTGVVSAGIAVGVTLFSAQSNLARLAERPGTSSIPGASLFDRVLLAVVIGSNAVLYLMMSASLIEKHAWKWLVVALMVIGSIMLGLSQTGGYLELARPVMLFLGGTWFLSGTTTLGSYLWKAQHLTGTTT